MSKLEDSRLRLALLEISRPPNAAIYVYGYDDLLDEWFKEDSLGDGSPSSGDLGYVNIFASSFGSVLAHGHGGYVVIRRRNMVAGLWEVEAVLSGINKPGGSQSAFGSSISGVQLPSGEELVFIGAQNGGNLNGPVREGSAYAFVRSPANPPGPGAWEMEERILAPDGEEGDEFGSSVAVLPTLGLPGGHAGDALVLIGANLHPRTNCPLECQKGAVYVYTRDGATETWTYETKFVSSDLAAFDYFGSDVVVAPLPDGEPGEVVALVGASGEDDLGPRAGAAYVFRREYVAVADTFRWVEEDKLLPELPSLGHEFGAAAALTVDTLASGTPVVLALVGNKLDENTEGAGHPGEASLFVRSTATGEPVWSLQATYQSGEPETNADWFGHAVAFARTEEGPLALVGAYRSDAAFEMGHPNGQNAGAVFVYDASVTTAGQPEAPIIAERLHLHPNPTHGELTATFTLTKGVQVVLDVFDSLGRRVLKMPPVWRAEGTHVIPLSLDGLPSGVYYARLKIGEGWQSGQFTVRK